MKLSACILALAAAAACAASEPLRVRVVVVTMFEVGAPTGDAPGEFQHWVERFPLDEELPFPAGPRPLRLNRESGVLGIVTGAGIAQATASVLALGLDPRFDTSEAYWVVAGIAGVDPADASPGSAVWARWVVDGDLAHEIDAREIPADWPHGYVALGARRPDEPGEAPWLPERAWRLDPALVERAYALTRDIALPDADAVRALRERFPGAEARLPPRVLLGDNLSSSTYWHGARLNAWANAWVRIHTGGDGNYVTTAMEDSGTCVALRRLHALGRADFARLLVLRTASNFDQPPPGQSPADAVSGDYSGLATALEAAWLVGSPVVRALAE